MWFSCSASVVTLALPVFPEEIFSCGCVLAFLQTFHANPHDRSVAEPRQEIAEVMPEVGGVTG